jgi:hypothetical protein
VDAGKIRRAAAIRISLVRNLFSPERVMVGRE